MAAPRETNLKRKLAGTPEREAFDLILRHFGQEPSLGLRLAKARLTSPKYFARILRYGLENAGPSRIGDYLDCCRHALGRAALIDEIDDFAGPNNPTVRAAMKHLGVHLAGAAE